MDIQNAHESSSLSIAPPPNWFSASSLLGCFSAKKLVPRDAGGGNHLAKWNNNSPTDRFPWNKGSHFPSKTLPFGVRSCEVAIIWPETMKPMEGMGRGFWHDFVVFGPFCWQKKCPKKQPIIFFGPSKGLGFIFFKQINPPQTKRLDESTYLKHLDVFKVLLRWSNIAGWKIYHLYSLASKLTCTKSTTKKKMWYVIFPESMSYWKRKISIAMSDHQRVAKKRLQVYNLGLDGNFFVYFWYVKCVFAIAADRSNLHREPHLWMYDIWYLTNRSIPTDFYSIFQEKWASSSKPGKLQSFKKKNQQYFPRK